MDFKKIIFGVIIVIILYIFYTSVFADKSKTNLVDLHNAKGNSQISSTTKTYRGVNINNSSTNTCSVY